MLGDNVTSVKGYVFIIVNECMPGLVKVGFSLRDPQFLALKLDGTHVPLPFTVAYELLTEDPERIEKEAHKSLFPHHVGREWFRCSVAAAVVAIKEYAADAVRYEALKGGREQDARSARPSKKCNGRQSVRRVRVTPLTRRGRARA